MILHYKWIIFLYPSKATIHIQKTRLQSQQIITRKVLQFSHIHYLYLEFLIGFLLLFEFNALLVVVIVIKVGFFFLGGRLGYLLGLRGCRFGCHLVYVVLLDEDLY